MGETHENVVANLAKIKDYQTQFRAVFGTDVSLQSIANAIAAYERTIISTNSPFDRYVLGDLSAMRESAVRGMAGKEPAASYATMDRILPTIDSIISAFLRRDLKRKIWGDIA